MSDVPLEDRKMLWAWLYGLRAFEHCKACCDHIIKTGMTDEHPLYYSLNVAAHINYGKPFRHSRGIERLPDNIIPERFRGAHNQFLVLRDKLYAHTDVVGNTHPTGELRVDVIYMVEGRRKGLEILEVTVRDVDIPKLEKLCSLLIEKATYHMRKIRNRYQKELPQKDGEYRIGINAGDPPFTRISN